MRKLFYFWWFSPQTGVLYPRLWLYGYQGYYMLVLFLSGFGLWGIARQSRRMCTQREALLIVVFLVGLSGLQSFYYVEGRHRWAIEPLVIVLTGGSVVGLSRVVTTRWRNRLTASNSC